MDKEACLLTIELKRKVAKIGNSLRVTIPKEIAEILEIREGDTLAFSVVNGKVFVRKV